MKRKDENLYTTGAFAKYFGIKKDTLFYYDEIGLFSPAFIGENGYRYYTASQISPNKVAIMVSNESLTALDWFLIEAGFPFGGNLKYNDGCAYGYRYVRIRGHRELTGSGS